MNVFGDVRTIPASEGAKNIMKELREKLTDLFEEQRVVWQLGASLGIINDKTYEAESLGTFQNINSLDPDDVFQAIMLALMPNATGEERLKKLVGYAEWGIREIYKKYQNGKLDDIYNI